jgi:hypothetical protein
MGIAFAAVIGGLCVTGGGVATAFGNDCILASEGFGGEIPRSFVTKGGVEALLPLGKDFIFGRAGFDDLASGFWVNTVGSEGSSDLGIDLIWAGKGFGDLISGFRGEAEGGWGVQERGGGEEPACTDPGDRR